MVPVRNILYPTDFSSYSNQAYLHAVSLAECHRASLTVLSVYAPEGAEAPSVDRRKWREQLEQIRPLDPNIQVRHVFLEGDPAGAIVRFAAESNADLIVMGTHGRTGLERQLMGSVAESVLRDAPCSVLIVKLPRGHSAAQSDRPAIRAGAV